MSNSFHRVFTNYTVFWLHHTYGFNCFVANCIILKIDKEKMYNAYLRVYEDNKYSSEQYCNTVNTHKC
jgi:hypothetical protein